MRKFPSQYIKYTRYYGTGSSVCTKYLRGVRHSSAPCAGFPTGYFGGGGREKFFTQKTIYKDCTDISDNVVTIVRVSLGSYITGCTIVQ